MFCKKCGEKLDDNAFYCNKCGEKVEEAISTGILNNDQKVNKPRNKITELFCNVKGRFNMTSLAWVIISIVTVSLILFFTLGFNNFYGNEDHNMYCTLFTYIIAMLAPSSKIGINLFWIMESTKFVIYVGAICAILLLGILLYLLVTRLLLCVKKTMLPKCDNFILLFFIILNIFLFIMSIVVIEISNDYGIFTAKSFMFINTILNLVIAFLANIKLSAKKEEVDNEREN